MKPPEFELIQPHSLEEACPILGEHDGRPPSWPEALSSWLPFVTDSANPQFTPATESHGLWPWMNAPNFGRPVPTSGGGCRPAWGVSQVPRLRAETHFGVQARALPAGLHIRESAQNTEREIEQSPGGKYEATAVSVS